MKTDIKSILHQLGETITAELDASNDRAVSAEKNTSRLLNGLIALVEVSRSSDAKSSGSSSSIVPKKDLPTTTKCELHRRSKISDEIFFQTLSMEWQSAEVFKSSLLLVGVKVGLGTVYNRMRKLSDAFPDMIESAPAPARWRLREPQYDDRDRTLDGQSSRKPLRNLKLGPSHKNPRNMRPGAITDVRERIADLPPPTQIFKPTLYHGNCFEVMKRLKDGSIDLILVDPPYGTTGLNIDPKINLSDLWAEYRRVVKPTGTIAMFGSLPFSATLIVSAMDLFKYDLVWIKNNVTQSLQAANRPLKQHEDILIFSCGTTIQKSRSARRYTYNPVGQCSGGIKKVSPGKSTAYLANVKHKHGLEYESTTNNPRTTLYCPKDLNGIHQFQKPLDLLEYLIRTYSNEGDIVLDSFVGSGSTCIAAMRSGRQSIGIEMCDIHFHSAQQRVDCWLSRCEAQ